MRRHLYPAIGEPGETYLYPAMSFYRARRKGDKRIVWVTLSIYFLKWQLMLQWYFYPKFKEIRE
jgi:hypothetical protein